ncbi:MAG: radical SAM protein [Magnetococcales bacterium]|nr:radical SAM protein [Magnetococcales bacterium]
MEEAKQRYRKGFSFANFWSRAHEDVVEVQSGRAVALLQAQLATGAGDDAHRTVWQRALEDLTRPLEAPPADRPKIFEINRLSAEEMTRLEDGQVTRYLYHRFRYDIFPGERRLDDAPTCVQVEPTSICNFRCTFCYQADRSFSDKRQGHMGSMTLDLYKRLVDQLAGRVEFISLASRGEPMICKAFPEMLEYSASKFIGLKVNTNASLMTERIAHALLSGGVNWLVFSVDAADAETFARLRVNGDLDDVRRKMALFREIQAKHYPDVPIITRASGVLVEQEGQKIDDMQSVWGELVDQVTFVKYNPWENTYENSPTEVTSPCSDLWRRTFVWHDGVVNPCDCDYKSNLKVGSAARDDLLSIWRGAAYDRLRAQHLMDQRQAMEPCRRCYFL